MTAFLRFLILFGAGILALSSPAMAQEAVAPATTVPIRGGVHKDYDRVVVDWPRPVAYAVHRDGANVIVEFSAAAQANWRQVTAAKLTRASNFAAAAGKDDHLVISFNVNPKATLKDFTSGHSIVIDILDKPMAAAQAPQAAPKPPEQKAVEPPKAVAEKPEAAPATPALPAEKQKPAPVAEQPPAPVAVKPAPPAPSAAPPQEAPAKEDTAPAPTPVTKSSLPEITDTPLLVASLDPHADLRTAAWQRGGYGYIVFDRKLTLGLDALLGNQMPKATLEPLELAKSTGYRFALPPDTQLRATRNGTAWQIFVSRARPDVPVSAALVPQPDFALGARFLLPLPDAPEPVTFTDPVVGDDLILIPLEQSQAFSVEREMSDFEVLPAAQGLVIKPLGDKVIVRAVTDGIEITSEGGLRLSSSHDTGVSVESSQRAKAAAAGKSMFDFNTWRGKPTESFSDTRQRLQQTIIDVPEAERNRARLELARFYFAHGYGEEAHALLTHLVKLIPDLEAHADFRVLRGAAKILAWRAEDGLKDLDMPELSNQPEVELWEAVAYAELRNWKDAEEKFAITEKMLAAYPEPFYSRFSVLAIESALAVNKDREAADWLDRLENGRHSEIVKPAMSYLHGALHAKAGRAQQAEQYWKKVAASNDRLYRVRAEMALIDLGVSRRSLTPAQAADRFEALRFAWRGDDLELDILHRLGQFYIQAKNVKAGLNTLSRAIQLYPKSPFRPKIQEEMSHIFHDIFLTDLGKQLPPLDALTLYQQYRSLMPSGKEGDAVMRNLAERLVAIDLLDQAADLLTDLVKNRLQGEEKGQVGARLAAIRLLDHKPQEAMAALEMTNSSSYSPELQNERLLLKAKTLSEMRKDEEALALLQSNGHEAAKILRADITMRAGHWKDAAKALLDVIGQPPDADKKLTPNQASWLVNAAIAFSMADDKDGLAKLAADYGAAIAPMPQSDTFRMLTQPENTDQIKDIAAAQSKIADVDMFQGFLNNYRKATTGSGTKSAEKEPATEKP